MNWKENGMHPVFLSWNRVSLVFTTWWILQKWLACIRICFRKTFFTENDMLRSSWSSSINEKKLKTYFNMLWSFNYWLKKAGVLNLLQLLTSIAMKFFFEVCQRESEARKITSHSQSKTPVRSFVHFFWSIPESKLPKGTAFILSGKLLFSWKQCFQKSLQYKKSMFSISIFYF